MSEVQFQTTQLALYKSGAEVVDLSLIHIFGQNLFQPSHVEAAGDPVTLVGIVRSGYLKLTWTH